MNDRICSGSKIFEKFRIFSKKKSIIWNLFDHKFGKKIEKKYDIKFEIAMISGGGYSAHTMKNNPFRDIAKISEIFEITYWWMPKNVQSAVDEKNGKLPGNKG